MEAGILQSRKNHQYRQPVQAAVVAVEVVAEEEALLEAVQAPEDLVALLGDPAQQRILRLRTRNRIVSQLHQMIRKTTAETAEQQKTGYAGSAVRCKDLSYL